MKKIILFLLLLISFESFGQVKQQLGTYGVRTRRIQADSAIKIPTFQVGIKDAYAGYDTGQIYYNVSDSSFYGHTGSAWRLLRGAGANSWSSTGNAGTTPGTNFLGTTDMKSLVFKINNEFSGMIHANGFNNTSLGIHALETNFNPINGGNDNSAIGIDALRDNTEGIDNNGMGNQALTDNTLGNGNTAIGSYSLKINTTGSYNTGIGYQALGSIQTSDYNIGIGYNSGGVVTTGSANVFIGKSSGNLASQKVDARSSFALGSYSYTSANNQLSISDSLTRFTFPGVSRGVANYVLTDSLGDGQYWVARPMDGGVTTMATIGSSPNANGASISGVTLTMQPADATFGGVMTAGTQSIAGSKTFTNATTTLTNTIFNDNGSRMRISPPTGGLEIYTAGQTTDILFYNSNATDAIRFDPENRVIYAASNLYVVGGTAVGSSLALKSTAGVGTTDFITFQVGNNGATEAMRMINSGNVGIGTATPDSALQVYLGAHFSRGIKAENLPTFADTTNFKPVVINTTGTAGTIGTIYKATYWPGGGGGGGWGTTGTVATLTGASTLAMATNTFDFSNGRTIFSTSGGASTPALSMTGNPYTAGTATTNHPLHYINGGTAPTTWSTAGTYTGINAVSGFTGNLLDYHINGGTSVAKIDYQGTYTGYGVSIGKYGGSYGITAPGDFYVAASGGTLISFLQGSQGFTMTTNAGVTTGMNVIYGGNTGYVKMGSNLSIYGSAGELRLGSAGTENYQTITSGGLIGMNQATPTSTLHTKSFATAYVAKSADYTATISDYTIEVTANSPTITLPTAVGVTGRFYFITNSGAGTVTLATTSSQVFRNVSGTPTSLSLGTLTGVTVQSNGADWLKVSSF